MTRAVYPAGREGLLDRSIDATGDIRIALVRAAYVFSAAHRVVRDVLDGINGRSEPLTDKTYTGGLLMAADTPVKAATATPCGGIVVYQHTGNDATARLLSYTDEALSSLPFTPAAGQTVLVKWDRATGVFRI